MVAQGICEECEESDFDIVGMSNQLLTVIRSQPSWDQTELLKYLKAEGWSPTDYSFCLSLLNRNNKITLMSD
ncbi:hypothetical protein A8708_30015 [Paenibacillus oryzisoli]|uniref:Uncharacterized protein n=2 Tax=Paenibacillus oryzisoli TaxID=1850517 RepID=A0A198AJM0_9BACL|nr:hypothetical protein A8708_30015 [Paenibacillus oryzisoli]